MDLNKNRLFEEAKTSKRLPGMIVGIICVVAFVFAGQYFGAMIFSLISNIFAANIVITTLLRGICGFSFVLLLVFAEVKFIEKRKISTLGFHKENFVIKYLTGFIIGFIMISLVVLILKLTGNVEVDLNPGVPSGMVVLSSILFIIPAWMIQSATEEVLTRGWLMNILGAKYNAWIALIVSSSIFGGLHLMNPGVDFISVLNIILIGLFLGLYAIKTNQIWGICGIHAAWNWAQGNIYGFEVSGTGRSPVGSLIHFKSTGANWVTGGSFGPEAGAVTSAIIVIAIIILLIVLSKKNKK